MDWIKQSDNKSNWIYKENKLVTRLINFEIPMSC